MNLILLGAPGSGKGTQAKFLAEHYKIKKIVVGDILREEVKNNTPLGKVVSEYMNKGVLVPDNIIIKVIQEKLNSSGFILDGFPRNLVQAKMLEEILKEKALSLDRVIYLKVNEEKAVERLSGRRVCKNCGAIYHIVNMPPQKEGICDKCGEKLMIRDDDREETVKKRWQVFRRETSSLIDHYLKDSKLLEVDANKSKEEVFSEIKKALNSYGKDKDSSGN
ncbi:MAG TPA: adenylate kinase [Candidatus Omnitrophica bacterium]|nr:MAG: adenylate kinase [Candidatus Omnitrophota bacterium]RKY43308.1 MAG: adenylate kinase [Candidatus Omnitrophota bacterium]HEC69075.1 adenylate kinase [Candidatus Omnitrophota bacterium]